ncbi:MAG TPA: LysR family transcriptional regulator [Rhodocyclaceae bacterium]|nr:LysR family transcriptional regulator [Rhodocyclaceae bacterium]
MDILLNIKAFLATAQTRSFSAAARQLGVAPSVITKRVSQLEWRVRSQLFVRTTRKVTLTEAGEKYLPKLRLLMIDFDDTLSGIASVSGSLAGNIRVKVPTTIGLLYLGKMLIAFQQKNPHVSIEVVLMDRSVNPVAEGFDIVIGALTASYGNTVHEPLCAYPRLTCASPAYLQRKGRPEHPNDLVNHDCLIMLPIGPIWSFESSRGSIQVEVSSIFSTNDNQILLTAAREGMGVAILAKYMAMPAILSGELVPVMDEFPLPDLWLKAMIPVNRINEPRIRALLDWLKLQLSPIPPWER